MRRFTLPLLLLAAACSSDSADLPDAAPATPASPQADYARALTEQGDSVFRLAEFVLNPANAGADTTVIFRDMRALGEAFIATSAPAEVAAAHQELAALVRTYVDLFPSTVAMERSPCGGIGACPDGEGPQLSREIQTRNKTLLKTSLDYIAARPRAIDALGEAGAGISRAGPQRY